MTAERTGVDLEIVEAGEPSAAHPAPLLFVHGAWNGAWVWERNFLPYFAERGFHAVALSLRGHGASPAPAGLHAATIADYADDVAAVAAQLGRAPVLIGHSMGGMVVQKYLQTRPAPAAVLLGSMPPRGGLAAGLRWARAHPWHFAKISLTGASLRYVNTPALARERFFSPDTPEQIVVDYAARLTEESRRVGASSVTARVRPHRVSAPMLVLGAEHDGATSAAEVRATARAYGSTAEFFAMGHAMMCEPDWAAVAGRIENWLTGRGL